MPCNPVPHPHRAPNLQIILTLFRMNSSASQLFVVEDNIVPLAGAVHLYQSVSRHLMPKPAGPAVDHNTDLRATAAARKGEDTTTEAMFQLTGLKKSVEIEPSAVATSHFGPDRATIPH